MSADRTEPVKDAPKESQPGGWRLQFGLLGGAVAWLLHLLLAYLVAEFGCLLNLGTVIVGPISLVAWGLLTVSILTLVMAVSATFVSVRLRAPDRSNDTDRDRRESVDFTGRSGLFMNVLFVFIILVQSIPIFYFLTDC